MERRRENHNAVSPTLNPLLTGLLCRGKVATVYVIRLLKGRLEHRGVRQDLARMMMIPSRTKYNLQITHTTTQWGTARHFKSPSDAPNPIKARQRLGRQPKSKESMLGRRTHHLLVELKLVKSWVRRAGSMVEDMIRKLAMST
jgi:hypothetical protein